MKELRSTFGSVVDMEVTNIFFGSHNLHPTAKTCSHDMTQNTGADRAMRNVFTVFPRK